MRTINSPLRKRTQWYQNQKNKLMHIHDKKEISESHE